MHLDGRRSATLVRCLDLCHRAPRSMHAMLVFALVALVTLATSTVAVAAAEQTVNVYNWNDYIAPKVLQQFQKETGIRVQYDTYDANEVLESKLLVSGSGYDVVFPTARPFADRHLQHGVYRLLDTRQLPNLKNLDPAILHSLVDIDPGNKHVLPYTWGTTGRGCSRCQSYPTGSSPSKDCPGH